MKVFLDTNILIDIYANRQGAAVCLEALSFLGPYDRICVSYLSLANFIYILRKKYSEEQMRSILGEINSKMKVLPGIDQHFYDLQKFSGNDLEDCLQILCAEYEKCDVILTRNEKDFKGNTVIPVLTPEQFLLHTKAATL